MSQEQTASIVGRKTSAKNSRSHSTKNPQQNIDQRLSTESPVQVRRLSPNRTPQEYIIESRQDFRNMSPHSSGTVPPFATPTKAIFTDPEVEQIIATRIIERCWLSYRDTQMFKLLKHAVCAAEHSISHEILKKVNPKEAELLKDKSMPAKIRFRFSGSEFPPMIYFKVYTCNTNGFGVKYVSGKKMIQPASEAARDACDLMGHRKFYDQLIKDMMRHDVYKVTDEVDVTTMKDYMQYLSLLDETPSYLGGRDNSWRRLTLEVLPRYTVFYDIIGYLYTRKMSSTLKSHLPNLLMQPNNEETLLEHIRIISEIRRPDIPPPNVNMMRQTISESARRTRKAKDRALKMRRAYQNQAQTVNNSEVVDNDQRHHQEADLLQQYDPLTHDLEQYSDNEEGMWDEEADKLYEWTQQLSYEDIAATPQLATSLAASRIGSVLK